MRVEACAINYPDALIVEDKYQFRPLRPFSPGTENAGIVEAVGEDVEGWIRGDRVIAEISFGGLAEAVVIPAVLAFKLAAARRAVEGAALLMTYATGIHALVGRGNYAPAKRFSCLGQQAGLALRR